MKIALIVNPLIPVPPEKYGGIERIVFMLIKELSPHHDITLFAHPASKVDCKLVPYTESKNYWIKDFIKLNILTYRISLQGFDLVHTFGRMSNITLLMFTEIPKLVSYQLPPTVSRVKKAIRIAPKRTLYFTACSNYIKKKISIYADVTTIYNGIDLNYYHFNSIIENNAPLIFLGRIQEEKGTDIAIEVAKRTGKNLIIAGNIPNETIHKQYFDEYIKPQIDNNQIKYIGPVDDDQKNILLQNALALLMPVTWDEPFGIVMTEALACGTPVIGLNRGAIPEIVLSNINGFICNDINEMIEAIDHINEIDRNNCRKIAEEHFSSSILAKQYEQLYQKIIRKKK